ncbi:glucosamine inositolphosphorylceramide transferase family protein [Aliiruegeria lutimaris]|uniref:glucosamine inositolphosphorylceramide transferase family protein n=1 Tax=Aliiruegeria lutimaris TaxID=571298 RepID=UPI001113CB10
MGNGSLGCIDLAGAKDQPLPHEGLRADPFLIEKDGTLYCFYEDFPDGAERAFIAVSKVEADGLTDLGVALRTSYHLSYPFIFEHDGEIYMMPETLAANRVEIWRATSFPLEWELHNTALEGQQFADPVIFRQGEDWWFMASPCHDSLGDFSSEMWLFKADGPFLNALTPHPLNPVVLGSSAGRGAGRVFNEEGRLLRMAQDNSGRHYGYGMRIMEITELSMTTYEERCIRHWRGPEIPGAIGCHHMDFAGGRFVADVRWP